MLQFTKGMSGTVLGVRAGTALAHSALRMLLLWSLTPSFGIALKLFEWGYV